MNRTRLLIRRLRSWGRDESGQAMAEYASITTIMVFGAICTGLAWPYTKFLFQSLQSYVDLYFYALNLAIG